MIREAAAWGGWMAYHTHDSRRSEPGFPDLVLVRGGECLAVEVKAAGGRATAAQLEWLAALDAVPGIVAELVQGDAEVSALCGRLMRRSGSA